MPTMEETVQVVCSALPGCFVSGDGPLNKLAQAFTSTPNDTMYSRILINLGSACIPNPG